MVCSTGRMLQLNLLDSQMQTGQAEGMLETGNQPPDIKTHDSESRGQEKPVTTE